LDRFADDRAPVVDRTDREDDDGAGAERAPKTRGGRERGLAGGAAWELKRDGAVGAQRRVEIERDGDRCRRARRDGDFTDPAVRRAASHVDAVLARREVIELGRTGGGVLLVDEDGRRGIVDLDLERAVPLAHELLLDPSVERADLGIELGAADRTLGERSD